MANSIGLAKKYIPLLDEVYKSAAKTAFLDAPEGLVREGMTANSILIPKIAMQGLGDYNKATGYVNGDVTFAWETHTFTQDRGRSFVVDAIDDMETVNTAFASVSSQFVRAYVVPEVDAYRFAVMSAKAVAAGNTAAANLAATTGLEAIDTALEAMANDEVNLENVILYVSPTMYTYLKQSDQITRMVMTNVGSAVGLTREIETVDGHPLIVVPQGRFYSAITQLDGYTGGEEAGGFTKAAGAKDINFMLVDPSAVLGVTKTATPRIWSPEQNIEADAWKFDYRLYHDIFVPDNKVNGLYVHTVA